MIAQHNGFSLLEILVAFAIMAVALTIVLRIFGTGVNAAVMSEDYNLAVQIGESLMARTGVETPLQVGEWSGSEVDKYDWLVKVSPMPQPSVPKPRRFASQQDEDETPPPQLMRVDVEVAWGGDDERRRSLQLHALKLLPPQDL